MTEPLRPSQTFALAVKAIETANVFLPISRDLDVLLTPRNKILLCAFHLDLVAQTVKKYKLPVVIVNDWSVQDVNYTKLVGPIERCAKRIRGYCVIDDGDEPRDIIVTIAQGKYFCDSILNLYQLGLINEQYFQDIRAKKWKFDRHNPLGTQLS